MVFIRENICTYTANFYRGNVQFWQLGKSWKVWLQVKHRKIQIIIRVGNSYAKKFKILGQFLIKSMIKVEKKAKDPQSFCPHVVKAKK